MQGSKPESGVRELERKRKSRRKPLAVSRVLAVRGRQGHPRDPHQHERTARHGPDGLSRRSRQAKTGPQLPPTRLKNLEADKQNKTFARFKSYSTLLFRSIDALSRYGSPDNAAELARQKEIYEELMQQLRSSTAVKDACSYYVTRIDR